MKKQSILAAGALFAQAAALAHEGHGLEAASHWHATDTFGLVLAAGALALALWFTRGRK